MKYLSCLLLLFLCANFYAQPANYPYIAAHTQDFSRIFPDENPNAMNANRWTPLAVYKTDLHTLYGDNNGIYYSYSSDNGSTWKKETLISQAKINHVGNVSIAPFNAEVEVDCEGAVHLFFVENLFNKSPSKLWHYKRARGKKDWRIEVVDKTSANEPFIGMDLDVVIDPQNNIHLVYNMGEQFTRYAFFDQKKWGFSDIEYGVRPMGCSIVADSSGTPYILIGCFNNNVTIATRSNRKSIKWDFDEVGYLGTWPCDLALGKNGTMHVVYNPVMNASYNIPFKYARKEKDGRWETRDYGMSVHAALSDEKNESLYNGNNMRTRIKSDPLGRIHMVFYPHFKNKNTRESLVYMYSEDDGKTWKQQWMGSDVTGHVETGYPDIGWNGNNIFICYKSGERPAILRAAHQYKELGRQNTCEPEEEIIDSLITMDSLIVKTDTTQKENLIAKDSLRNNNVIDLSKVNERKGINHGAFTTKDDFIIISVKDAWDIDGDTITLMAGDSCILHQYALTGINKEIKIILTKGEKSRLVLYANSEGRKPPCTVSLTIKDSMQTRTFKLSSNLEENGFISLYPK